MKSLEYLGFFIVLIGLAYVSLFSFDPRNLFTIIAVVSGTLMSLTSFINRKFNSIKKE